MRLSIIVLALLLVSISCSYDFSSISSELKKHFDIFDGRISWMVQRKNGEILFKEHLADSTHTAYTDDTAIHIASGCKWPAMTVIMKLVEDGKLSLTDTIDKFYTNNEFSSDASKINLLQLMTHQSGYGYFDDWCAALDISLQDSVLGIAQGGKIGGQSVAKDTLVNPPGTKVLYGDIGMQIAGAIAEKVSGKGFNQLFQDILATPLAMTNAKFCAFDGDDGINIAVADGMYIKMTDYANFMLMLMNGGMFNGKQVIKSETVDIILKDYTSKLAVDPTNDKYATDGKLIFGIGHWILNDGSYHSSNGVHKFYNYFDTKNDYLAIFYLRTELDTKDESDALFDTFSGEIESIINSSLVMTAIKSIVLLIIVIGLV